MNLAQRFTLLVKGRLNGLFDSLEDPEQSLYQLILDMEEQLDAAKQATAQAMANEDRLRQQIEIRLRDVAEWEESGRRALERGDEIDARATLERAETGERQAERLRERLAQQEVDTAQIRETVERWHEQVEEARGRLELLQARLRQSEARRNMAGLMQGVAAQNLHSEFERLGDRVDRKCAVQNAHFRLESELRGDDLKKRCEQAAVQEAVDRRLDRLRQGQSASPGSE